jgi:methylmalonyl-CoA/ethylmalonyl-CoA epimerase
MPDADVPATLRGLPLDHVAIALRELGDAATLGLLGLPSAGPDEEMRGQGVRVRTLRAGDALVELLAPLDANSPVARFLERRGPGLHHLALRVSDVRATVTRLQGEGAVFVDPVPRPGRGGSRVVFLHPSWTGGVLIELVEHA